LGVKFVFFCWNALLLVHAITAIEVFATLFFIRNGFTTLLPWKDSALVITNVS